MQGLKASFMSKATTGTQNEWGKKSNPTKKPE